jgi:hypothetical protein
MASAKEEEDKGHARINVLVASLLAIGIFPEVEGNCVRVAEEEKKAILELNLDKSIYDLKTLGIQNGIELKFDSKEEVQRHVNRVLACAAEKRKQELA